MARKPRKDIGDDGNRDRSNVNPRAAVYRVFRPKKGLTLVADEWEDRLGWRDTAKPKFQTKPYGGSLGRGGSGDPNARQRKAAKRKPLY